ncbi:hypothetical protein A3F45_00155 [Candidatus Curtissbacteria bacterium RIFCSPHIGHO2_12_FULL_41_17]|uniref:Excalibur calcium-binding domain-containing protein n=1 Tax=Candidatus Curtissbacteria bacterium RIFCSPHIGHO2_12_FULL_41_17 TaxID=1797722 RepID=A0A1F5HNJ0_9BACT|nr:MAG: hypothetical protein A3F45_00155 [Candidatus Curtissbacteria bacterium RIFCSPHIGHO2_12_FULL_41_17]
MRTKILPVLVILFASVLLSACESSSTGSVQGIDSTFSRDDDPKTERSYPDRDCADFSSQSEAQDFFEENGVDSDPHNLDRDGDSIACESL